ncbi:MAG: two-component regulator propeller domain-containing protein [Cyclobacteriaceae bacterium]
MKKHTVDKMEVRWIKALLFLCFYIFLFGSNAQYSNPKFESFSTTEGLSSSTCLEVFQDSEGFLWFGTIDGLNRYDGYEFEVFKPIIGNPNSISNNRVNSIAEDGHGNIWVGTSNGLNVYNKDTHKFYRIPLHRDNPDNILIRDIINVIYFDKSMNILWVGTKNGLHKTSLERFNVFTSIALEFDHYTNSPGNLNTLDNNDIEHIYAEGSGAICVVTAGSYLNRYHSEVDHFERVLIDVPRPFALNHLPKETLLDRNGKLWIGNDLSKIVVWDQSKDRFELLSPINQTIPIFDLYQDKRGYIWVATDGFGVYLMDEQGYIVQHMEHDPTIPFSLPNNQPSKVLQDQQGIFWFATYNEGVVKLVLSKSNFGHYFYRSGSENGLSAPIAQSVLQDSREQLWIGTDGGGLNLFLEESEKFKHFRHLANNPRSLSSDKILFLEESYDGGLWICTWDGGLNKFDPVTGQVTRFLHNPADETSIGQNTVWCAVEDKRHWVWVGTQTSGLNVYLPEKDIFKRFTYKESDSLSLNSDFVFSLFIDSKERLLVGTSTGLSVLELSGIEVPDLDSLRFQALVEKNLLGNRVNYITEDHEHNIWLGTDLGLHKLNDQLQLIRSYSVIDGMPNNLILGVKEDDSHDIWITTKSGMSRLKVKSNEVETFNVNDGLQGVEFQSKSIEKTRDGRIVAGGINGFNIFNPANVGDTLVELKPSITRLRIFNNIINVGDTLNGRVLLDRALDQTEKLILNYDEGYLTFEFLALHLKNPEGVKYAYRMEGLEEDFVQVRVNRLANYAGLNPGNYIFEVKALIEGDWDQANTTSLSITILPPPWRTWWAYLAYVAILSLIIWLGLKYYNRIINEEREHELDQLKLRFFMNVSHEFRTPLTLILNPVQKIMTFYHQPEIVKESAAVIQRSAHKLLSLINQLLDFRRVDLGKAPLDPVKGDIVSFLKDIHILFEDLAIQKSIQYNFHSSEESIYLWFDPDKMEKIINNLLSNALKFTQDKGAITLTIQKIAKRPQSDSFLVRGNKQDFVEISVKDTGVGIKKEQQHEIFERFFHVDNTRTGTGIGLNFTKSLVEQHAGEIEMESTYGEGSEFIVRIPFESSQLTEALKANREVRQNIREFDISNVKSLEYDMAIYGESPSQVDYKQEHTHQTILIVEDNKELRIHLKNELKNHFNVREAVNGAEGLEKVKKYFPDIIVSDVMMPEMDGFEMCGKVKTDLETCHIPIILLTARSLEEDRIEGYNLGADAYLPKPFNVSVLKARIQNLLETRRKIKERFLSQASILSSSEVTTNTLDEKFLDDVNQVIMDHIDDSDFGLESLITELGVSRSQFYRKINSLTGQNPSNYIRTIRLKFAAELLKEKSGSIKEIAFRSGFNSTAYFSKTFRELFGMTPVEFSEQNMKEIQKTS